MRKYSYLILFLIISPFVSAGSLYTFNKSEIQLKALSWIKFREKDISKLELKADNVSPYIKQSGEVEVKVYFSYKSNAEYGFSYICIHMNENGELLGLTKDINVYKNSLGMYYPINPSCG